MDRGELREAFSSLLGLSPDSVLNDRGNNSLCLSDWALHELDNLVNLPDGYVMTGTIRTPNPGDFFLDVSALVEEERVVVYRATGDVKAQHIILKSISDSPVLKPPTGMPQGEFDFFLCMLQGGAAMYRGKMVRLLVPAVDSDHNVIVVSNGKFCVVPVSKLSHVSNSEIQPANPKLFYKKKKPPPHDYSDRFGLKFDDDIDLDDLNLN